MYNLRRFGFSDMMACRSALRTLFDDDPPTLGDVAERTVRYFYDQFVDEVGKPAFALVRVFKTHLYDRLDAADRDFARALFPQAEDVDGLRCLVLLATAGERPEWNSRERSVGHRAIPLASEKMVEDAPMIAQLIKQIGVDVAAVVRPDPTLLLGVSPTHGNVFYVPVAKGSPHIVAQKQFVEPAGIESVIGFGGVAATGELLATILFSKVPIPPEVADLFRIVGMNLRLALLPFVRKPLFQRT